MLRIRIIPCLQLVNESLVKSKKFNKLNYIGDPINTVRIFNELEVDELCFLDIRATYENREPNLKILKEIADECFMPLSYGGGVKDIKTALQILSIGFEKIVLNSVTFDQPEIVTELASLSGSQSVVVSVDIRKNFFGKYIVYSHDGTRKQSVDVIKWVRRMENCGAGELLITSMDRDGTWTGFEVDILANISDAVNIPVIANGGAGNTDHIFEILSKSKVSAVSLGSMVVYQKKDMGVLVNFPDKEILTQLHGIRNNK